MKKAIIITISFLIALIIFFVVGAIFLYYAISIAVAPTPLETTINEARAFVGVDFTHAYQVLHYESRNNHPDRPFTLVLSFNTGNDNIAGLVEYCKQQTDTIIIDLDDKYKISTTISISQESFTKRLHVEDTSINYPVFTKELNINYGSGILKYHGSGY